MNINLIGLGKMGLGMARNLNSKGYDVLGYDVSSDMREVAKSNGIRVVDDLSHIKIDEKDLNVVILSVPAGSIIDKVLLDLEKVLKAGDIIVDCGNSNYKDTMARYERLKEKDLFYLDCGVSGGPSGALNGACTMIGGDAEAYKQVKAIFDDMSLENGSLYVGKSGSGHFVKMVHNGIEYGMMQAIAEGYEIMEMSDFDIDLAAVSRLYNNGSVIRSWLIELMEDVLKEDPKLEGLKGVMSASGEAKWTVESALDLEVPAPVIALSLMMRNRSLKENTYSGRVVAALRNQFGGHDVVK